MLRSPGPDELIEEKQFTRLVNSLIDWLKMRHLELNVRWWSSLLSIRHGLKIHCLEFPDLYPLLLLA